MMELGISYPRLIARVWLRRAVLGASRLCVNASLMATLKLVWQGFGQSRRHPLGQAVEIALRQSFLVISSHSTAEKGFGKRIGSNSAAIVLQI